MSSRSDGYIGSCFPKGTIALILCPRDGGTLEADAEAKTDSIRNGHVICARCSFVFEIRNGILRLFPGQRCPDPVAESEQQARDDGAACYDAHFDEAENAGELRMILADPERFRSKRVLDLACGTGRLTRIFAALASTTVGVDLSEESLRLFGEKAASESRIGLIWADATQVLFAPESFDVVVSTQLLEHIQAPEKRIRLLRQVCSALKAGGVLLLTVYYYSLVRRILWRRRDGFHTSGIFYHRFTASEIRDELGQGYEVVETRPLQPDRRILARLRWARSWPYNPLFRRVLAELFGHLLYICSTKTVHARSSTAELPYVA